MRVALHWFRRDLRLADNTALAEATRAAEVVVPVVVLDTEALTASETAPARVAAMVGAVSDIAQRMARDGMGHLIVRAGDAAEELARLAREVGAEAIYANHSEGSRADATEQSVRHRLAGTGVALHLFDDLGVAPPGVVMTNANTPYTVYTPFRRRWQELIAAAPPREREPRTAALYAATPLTVELPTLIIEDAIAERGVQIDRWLSLWGGGRTAHLKQFHRFIENDLAAYVERRNLPAQEGTSRLSVALRWGTISAREALRAAQTWAAEHPEARAGADAWIGELAWADFFRALLHFFPQSERAAFRPTYDAIVWEGEDEHLAAWQNGRTGYPIVDAGMRQLLAEGWMHNRVRMIVASFLVKDLLLDWRAGERHFMRHLVDGAVSANVGNWQWAASTGADAQPWFRIFNPTSQGRTFDPDGEYVRRYVPELAQVPASAIHEPWRLSAEEQRRLGARIGHDYPAPIVDHVTQRARALAMFKAASGRRSNTGK
ncbi:MAG TPA: deoxyribodipyrimidine photo-lyase [Ktedonobacterales bacterium]|nr:deoxyribodipyrimidine photo-lyase [Ktedonobacterales bacterium]